MICSKIVTFSFTWADRFWCGCRICRCHHSLWWSWRPPAPEWNDVWQNKSEVLLCPKLSAGHFQFLVEWLTYSVDEILKILAHDVHTTTHILHHIFAPAFQMRSYSQLQLCGLRKRHIFSITRSFRVYFCWLWAAHELHDSQKPAMKVQHHKERQTRERHSSCKKIAISTRMIPLQLW